MRTSTTSGQCRNAPANFLAHFPSDGRRLLHPKVCRYVAPPSDLALVWRSVTIVSLPHRAAPCYGALSRALATSFLDLTLVCDAPYFDIVAVPDLVFL